MNTFPHVACLLFVLFLAKPSACLRFRCVEVQAGLHQANYMYGWYGWIGGLVLVCVGWMKLIKIILCSYELNNSQKKDTIFN